MKRDYKKEYKTLLSLIQDVLESVMLDVNWKERNMKFDSANTDTDAICEIYEIIAKRSKAKKPMFKIVADEMTFKWYDELPCVNWRDALFFGRKDDQLITGRIYRTYGELMFFMDNPDRDVMPERYSIDVEGVDSNSCIQDIGKAAAKKLGCSHYWQILGSEIELINMNPRAALANGVLTLTKTGD